MDDVQGPSPAPLDVRVTEAAGEQTVAIVGELDMSNVGKLRRVLERLPGQQGERLVLDTQGLRYMDSSGLSVILEAVTRGRSVVLRNPNVTIRRLIEVTGLTAVILLEPAD